MNEAAYIALREERDQLLAEVAYLKELYCVPADADFVSAVTSRLGVMPQVARMLWFLWDCRQKSNEALANSMWGNRAEDRDWKSINVQIHRLRKALRSVDADIENIWGHGYRLRPEERDKIASAIGIEVKP